MPYKDPAARRARSNRTARAWEARNPEKTKRLKRADRLRRNFGITIEQFDAMLAAQGGGCAICGTARCPRKGTLAVDHCHETGRVRGLLCGACNSMLGQAYDDPARLRSAAEYLDRNNAPKSQLR